MKGEKREAPSFKLRLIGNPPLFDLPFKEF